MPLWLVFVISYVLSFAVLFIAVWLVRRALQQRRRRALQKLMRSRALIYAQMNALLSEFQALARMSREQRVAAVSPDPSASHTGVLLADVADRLSIAGNEIDPDSMPRELRPVALALVEVVRVSLTGLRHALETRNPVDFVDALPAAAPTRHVEPLRRLDAELRPLAESEGMIGEEQFYQDARFYV